MRTSAWSAALATTLVASAALGQEESVLEFGGWIDVEAKANDKTGSDPSVDVHHMYLYMDRYLDANWRTFAELEFEHLPALEGGGGEGELKMERGYIEGRLDRWLTFRLGKFNTPFGLRNPDHWLILQSVIAKPIHEDNGYAPIKSVGLQALGWLDLSDEVELAYSVYGSNGTEVSGTDNPADGLTGLGGDLRLVWDEAHRIGASFHQTDVPREAGDTQGHTRARTFVGYLETDLPINVFIRTELWMQWRTLPADSIQRDSVSGGYALLKYRLHFYEPMFLAYRLDFGDDEKRSSGEKVGVMAHNFNIGWEPKPYVRFIAEVNRRDFEDEAGEDFWNFTFWAGAIF